jgi:RecA-family ATPase
MNPFAEALQASEPHAPEPANGSPVFESAFTPISAFARGWPLSEPPPRRWVVPRLLPAGRPGLFTGEGGVSKSRTVLCLAASIASGCNWFGFSIAEPGAVLILAGEDEIEEGHRRYKPIVQALPSACQADAWENLFFESRVGMGSLLTDVDPGTKQVMQTRFLCELAEAIKQIENLKAVFLDPLSRFRGGDENAARDTSALVQAVDWLSQETAAAIVLVHHVGKAAATTGAASNQHAARGSSSLVDGVRFGWSMSPVTPPEAKRLGVSEDDRRNFAKFSNTKNNYAKKFDDLFFDTSTGQLRQVFPSNINSHQADSEPVMTAAFEKIKTLVAKHGATGVRFSHRSFVETFAGLQGEFSMSKAALDLALKRAVTSGTVVARDRKGRGGGQELFLPTEPIAGGDDEII